MCSLISSSLAHSGWLTRRHLAARQSMTAVRSTVPIAAMAASETSSTTSDGSTSVTSTETEGDSPCRSYLVPSDIHCASWMLHFLPAARRSETIEAQRERPLMTRKAFLAIAEAAAGRRRP